MGTKVIRATSCAIQTASRVHGAPKKVLVLEYQPRYQTILSYHPPLAARLIEEDPAFRLCLLDCGTDEGEALVRGSNRRRFSSWSLRWVETLMYMIYRDVFKGQGESFGRLCVLLLYSSRDAQDKYRKPRAAWQHGEVLLSMLIYLVKKQTGILRCSTEVAITNNVSTSHPENAMAPAWRDSSTYRNVLLLHCLDFQGCQAGPRSCLIGKVKKPRNDRKPLGGGGVLRGTMSF